MPIQLIPAERFLEVQEVLRAEVQKPAGDVNADAVLALDGPIPLLWGDEEYQVAPVSYLNGVRLLRLRKQLDALAKPESAEDIDALEAWEEKVTEVLQFLWTLLDPRPPVNPFLDAAPSEVGALMDFFRRCLTMQSARDRLRMGRRSPSTT